VVLCVDEKSGMQALDRSQPVLPMMPGMPERPSHDYARHGVTSLFAAFDIARGIVIAQLRPQPHHHTKGITYHRHSHQGTHHAGPAAAEGRLKTRATLDVQATEVR
jgi:hypothetical protein